MVEGRAERAPSCRGFIYCRGFHHVCLGAWSPEELEYYCEQPHFNIEVSANIGSVLCCARPVLALVLWDLTNDALDGQETDARALVETR